MRPWRERKARLLAQVHARREETARQVASAFAPWRWLDRAWAAWQSVPPAARQAAGPTLRTLLRRVFPRASRLFRWIPLFAAAVRGMRRPNPNPATR